MLKSKEENKLKNGILLSIVRNNPQIINSNLVSFYNSTNLVEGFFSFESSDLVKAFFKRKIDDYDIVLFLNISAENDYVVMRPRYYVSQNGEAFLNDFIPSYECDYTNIIDETFNIIDYLSEEYCQNKTK